VHIYVYDGYVKKKNSRKKKKKEPMMSQTREGKKKCVLKKFSVKGDFM
jgi:hypothetical protein